MNGFEEKYTHEEMINDLMYHPVRAYFKYPIGRGYDLPRWNEGLDGIVLMLEAVWNFIQLYILLALRFIREVPLRPVYKAWLVIKWHRYFMKEKMKDKGHV